MFNNIKPLKTVPELIPGAGGKRSINLKLQKMLNKIDDDLIPGISKERAA